MKRLITLASIVLTPLCADFCNGTIGVEGAALYLKPTACEFPFAISDSRPFSNAAANNAHLPIGKHQEVDPSYEWGFRVGLSYLFDCYELKVGYSRLYTEDTGEANGTFWPTFAHPRYMGLVNGTGASADSLFAQSPFFSELDQEAYVRSRVDFEYDAIDLQFATSSLRGCRLFLRSYMGLHLAEVLVRFRADYIGTLEPEQAITATADSVMRFKDCSWGIGPLMGVDARYDLLCGFGLGGHLGFAVLAGKRDGNTCAVDVRDWMGADAPEDVDEMIFFHMEERAILVPYVRVGLGINYCFSFCSCKGRIELAYEYHSYINALHTFRFNDQRATGTADCQSFDLNGFTLSVHLAL